MMAQEQILAEVLRDAPGTWLWRARDSGREGVLAAPGTLAACIVQAWSVVEHDFRSASEVEYSESIDSGES